jgi:hypothetical protein
VLLDNFEAAAFYGVSLGPCSARESLDSVFVSEPVAAVTPGASVAARLLGAVEQLGGAYAHFWFRSPANPGLLLAGGNTSGLLAAGGSWRSRTAFAGEWFGQVSDDAAQSPGWIALTLRHY